MRTAPVVRGGSCVLLVASLCALGGTANAQWPCDDTITWYCDAYCDRGWCFCPGPSGMLCVEFMPGCIPPGCGSVPNHYCCTGMSLF